jgi:MFS family permease
VKSVLQLPAYRRLLSAYTLNELAWSIGMVALSFLIYHETGSALSAAGYYLCSQFIPALFSPMVVARVDRLPAARILAALYALEAGLFLALGWMTGRFAVAPVLVLTVLDGIVAVSARALGRAATARVTSAAGLLREGNALANTMYCSSFLVGPAIGGAVVAAGGVSTALFVNTGVFALVALTLGTAAGLPGAATEHGPTAGRIRSALGYARRHRILRALLSLQGAGLVFFTISMPIEVVYAQRALHAGAAGYGVLLSSWGAGAVAGSTIFMRWRRLPSRGLIAAGAGLLGLGFLVLAVAPVFGVAVVGSGIAGIGNGIETVAARTAIQEATEERWMALMMSFNESLAMFVPGLGIVIGGALAELTNPRIAWATAGVGALSVAAAVWIVLRPTGRTRAAPAEQPARESPAPRASPRSAAPPV